MSVPTVPMTEPPAQPELASEAPTTGERAPLRELLPTGTFRVVVAVTMAALVIGSFVRFSFSGTALLGAVLCPTLVLLGAIDLKHKLLPNEIILAASLAVGLIVAAGMPHSFFSHLAAGAALCGFFFLFGIIFRGSFGMGDAKLGFLLGLALGSKTLGATLIAFAGLLVAALYVLATRGLSARKDALPFGPFLALGGILAFFLS
jgi:leader peptidase (prepilin peptidase) / N-methyltransferase